MRSSNVFVALVAIGISLQGCVTADPPLPPAAAPPPPPAPPPATQVCQDGAVILATEVCPLPPPPPAPPPPAPEPIYRIELQSATATDAYAVDAYVVEGLSLQARQNHLVSYGLPLMSLPATIQASIGDQLWIVPQCGSAVRWAQAAYYTVNPNYVINIQCQP